MSSLEQQLRALGQIATMLQSKEDVPASLWAEAQMKAGSRQKDVATQITALKKRVSSQVKQRGGADDASDDAE